VIKAEGEAVDLVSMELLKPALKAASVDTDAVVPLLGFAYDYQMSIGSYLSNV
jgi:hypothetical protein